MRQIYSVSDRVGCNVFWIGGNRIIAEFQGFPGSKYTGCKLEWQTPLTYEQAQKIADDLAEDAELVINGLEMEGRLKTGEAYEHWRVLSYNPVAA